jgi:predicted dehydrogenase
MDYLKQSPAFKIRKVTRYARMYGPARTRVKVLGQLHMRKRFDPLPPASREIPASQWVGIIGCGNYAYSNIAYYLRKARGGRIGVCMDVDPHRAASLARAYGAPLHTTDAWDVIGNPAIRLVYIASNHASHAEYAIAALERGQHVYIEKPHVVTEDQLRRLTAAMDAANGKIFLGFNRPGSRFGQLILRYLREQNGPGMYNWFVAGHAIDPDHWYFRPEEGGRVLGNLCHWTDFVLHMAPESPFPVRIVPTRAARSDCDIAVTYTFGDGTIAAITFSAKGHTFEGVTERLSAHRGDCLIAMEDYKRLVIDVVERKRKWTSLFRDHGHRRNILAAFDSVAEDLPYDRPAALRHVTDTAWLFLMTREALERNESLVVERFAARPAPSPAGSD